jgi:protoporphyrinogen oxidase
MKYDYIIIGAGPTGLTLSYYLAKLNKKCLLIDKNENIGGCHRVTRVNGLFTEHSPRIYSNAYLNFIKLLKNMDTNFYDLFVDYNFNINNISSQVINNFQSGEIIFLIMEFISLFFNSKYSKSISIGEFMENKNFSEKTKDYIDRICRLSDGVGSDRYTLFQFLQLINQMSLYKLYQPCEPNDIGLFKIWYDAIKNTNNVDIILNTEVSNIKYDDNKIKSITINNNEYNSDNIILALPPKPLLQILKKSNIENSFIESNFENWVKENSYNNDIGIVFHWDQDLLLNKVWGYPQSEWGIAFIVTSDYTNFDDIRSKTVISTVITKTDIKSSFINKTVNECKKDELINETFRQLKLTYNDLPEPTYSILNPLIYQEGNEWKEDDTAYILSKYENTILPAKSIRFSNLYNCGTQNGKSKYYFTSIESAITNAISLLHTIEPETKKIHKIIEPDDIIGIIKFFMLIYFILFIFKKI